MKVLVVGSGGREHALAWKIAQSRRVGKIYCAPGNGGIAAFAECVAIEADDIAGILDFAQSRLIDLVVVGPEAPLVEGIVDVFQDAGLKVFGPRRRPARLEASKLFAKEIMRKYRVPTAAFAVCRTVEEVVSAVGRFGFPVVLKADGLAAGKGVVICRSEEEAVAAAREMLIKKVFGASGETIVVEEFLEGEEVSILVLTDGDGVLPLASSQDHKRVFDHDAGPNTGGMGAYSPAPVVPPVVMDEIMQVVVKPVIRGLAEEGMPYRGILYAGLMMTSEGLKVLEFNVRFGDPETQAVLARLQSDIVEAILWSVEGGHGVPALRWDTRPSVCVVMSSKGYPGLYETGKVISGLDEAARLEDVIVFHAGTKKSGDQIVSSGGRVLAVTGLGETLKQAIARAYEAVAKIHFEGAHYRTDIAWRALKNRG